MYKYGNYNIPRVAKTYHLYDYLLVPRLAVTSGAGNFSKWSSSSLANSIEDMITGAGNYAMAGYKTMNNFYNEALPITFRATHKYTPNYTPATVANVQVGKYILVGGWAFNSTNPFDTFVGAQVTSPTIAQHVEQILRAQMIPYFGTIKIFNQRSSVESRDFTISSKITLKQLTERSNPDLWNEGVFGFSTTAASTNPTSLLYFHSVLWYVRPFADPPLIQMGTQVRTELKIIWKNSFVNLVDQF